MSPVSDRDAFLARLIGAPYAAGAAGPGAYDCYGLAAHVLTQLFGADIPARALGPLSELRAWRMIDAPVDGAIVLMNNGRGRHIGVWLAPEGGCIHALEGVGVVFDDRAALEMRGFSCKFWARS